MYKHTLLIDNGFGSRQCLLSGFKFRTALGRPFDHPLHTGFHQYLLSGMLPDHLLFFLIGFVVLYFTALSGCLLSQSQKSVDINIGQGMVTIALASLLIGGTILGRGGIFVRAVGMVLGSFIFRLVYTIALRFNMPAFMLKLVSSVIVVLAISGPYLKKQWPQIRRRLTHKKGGR